MIIKRSFQFSAPSCLSSNRTRIDQEKETLIWQTFDDGAGNIYYYNSETGESQWECPDDLYKTLE